jgi:hypothetical protein
MHRTAMLVVLAALGAVVAPGFAHEEPVEPKPRTVEVCFVLDTTGSMSALIDGAKRKIWSIANEIVALKPTPRVRIGLIGYRDRKDAYVTKLTDLTEDLDAVYADLLAYQADGGGDTPESVNQALHEAVTKPSWTREGDVVRIVFLVGDAPPHMDYEDDVKYPETCRLALERGIVINTIQTGTIEGTREVWEAIAKAAKGGYALIPQDNVVRTIATPMDEKLAALNVAVGKTILAFGSAPERAAVAKKQELSECADAATAADRLGYNEKTGCVVQGGGDLVDAIDAGRTKLDDVRDEELPEDMRKMSADERKAHVEKLRADRKALQEKINKLLLAREAFIAAELKKTTGSEKDAFDGQVKEMITRQAAAK